MTAWMQLTFGDRSQLLFDFFSVSGGPYGWLIVVPLAFWLGGSRLGMRVALIVSLTMVSNTLLKWLLFQPRPYYVSDDVLAKRATAGLGMPSGHAQGVAAQWVSLAYFVRRHWSICLATAFIAFTGLSRVYLGVHSVMQVIVGWTLGLLTVIAVIRLEKPIVQFMQNRNHIQRLLIVLAVTLTMVLAGLFVGYVIRGDTLAPVEWRNRWINATLQLSNDAHASDLHMPLVLINPIHFWPTVGLFLGFSFCGLWFLRMGETKPNSWRERLLNLVIGTSLIVTIAFVVKPLADSIVGETVSLSLLAIFVPSLVTVGVPHLASRFRSTSAA